MAEAGTVTSTTRPLWRDRNFATYWSGQAVSQLGDRVSELALPLTAVTVVGATATQVGLLTAAIWLPNLLALVLGSWVDRQQRKRWVLVTADLLRAVVVLTVPVAALLGALALPQLFVVALLLGAGATLYQSAWQPFFVTLVRRDQYVEANSLLSTTRSVSFVAGPAVGGALVQALTAPVALAVDGVSFLLSAVLLRRVEVNERASATSAERGSLGRRVGDGLRIVLHHPYLAPALRCVTWVNAFTFMVSAVVLVFASRTLGLSAGTIGLALGVGAVGGVAGALAAAPVARRIGTGPTIAVGAVLFTLPMAALALAGGSRLSAALVLACVEAVSGFGVMLFDVNLNAVQAVVTPDAARGRVVGAFTTINYGIRPVGAVVGGLLADLVGVRPTLVIGGVGGALAVLWLLRTPLVRVASIDDLVAG
ncbi:MAG TPA: MFS transporter [Ornithinibacter sp.]|nr:MFS transporter [Ornithinibacter sp.]